MNDRGMRGRNDIGQRKGKAERDEEGEKEWEEKIAERNERNESEGTKKRR